MVRIGLFLPPKWEKGNEQNSAGIWRRWAGCSHQDGTEQEELLLCSVPTSLLGTASLVFQTHPRLLPPPRKLLNKVPASWGGSHPKWFPFSKGKNIIYEGELRTNSPKLGCEEQSVLHPTDPSSLLRCHHNIHTNWALHIGNRNSFKIPFFLAENESLGKNN